MIQTFKFQIILSTNFQPFSYHTFTKLHHTFITSFNKQTPTKILREQSTTNVENTKAVERLVKQEARRELRQALLSQRSRDDRARCGRRRAKWWINRISPIPFFINERAKGVDRVGGVVVSEAAV